MPWLQRQLGSGSLLTVSSRLPGLASLFHLCRCESRGDRFRIWVSEHGGEPCRQRQRQPWDLLSDSLVVVMGIQSTEFGEGERSLWKVGSRRGWVGRSVGAVVSPDEGWLGWKQRDQL